MVYIVAAAAAVLAVCLGIRLLLIKKEVRDAAE